MITSARSASTPPYAVASAVTSTAPSTGTLPSRAITVRPSRTTSGLTSPITSANGSASRSMPSTRRPTRAAAAAARIVASRTPSTSGWSNESAATARTMHHADATAARVAWSGLSRRR
jgi:hypothetical protein